MLSVTGEIYEMQSSGAVDKSQLYACIGETVKVRTYVRFEDVFTSSDDKVIDVGLQYKELPNTLERSGIIRVSGGSFFENVVIGDRLIIVDLDASSTIRHTVTEIIDSNTVRTDGTWIDEYMTLGGGNHNGYIGVITELNKLTTYSALSASGYDSIITEQKQVYSETQEDAFAGLTYNSISAVGKEWVTGYCYVVGQGTSVSETSQYLVIVSVFTVHPFYLAGQLDDLKNKIKPSYWNSLKHRWRFELGNGLLESNLVVSKENIGKFGWFNEKYNGSESKYSFSNFSINDGSGIVDRLQYGKINTVTFNLATTTDVFTGYNYSAIICVCRLPDDESLYKNNSQTATYNFSFENKRVILANPSSNGDNYGTTQQFIKTLEFEYVSTTVAKINIQIELGSDIESRFREMSTPNYAIWGIFENIDIAVSDKSCLLLQVDKFEETLAEVDLFDAETVFIEHPFETSDKGEDSLDAFPTDDLVVNTLLTLDYTGRETDDIKIISVTPSIRLVKTGEDDIILDTYTLSCENFPLVGSSPAIQDIATVVTRPFKLNQGVRTDLVFGRDYNNDVGNVKAWALNFPFIVRHEYWIKLLLNTIPSDLFDVAEPNKGINEFWHRYQTISGWSLNYNLNIVFEQKGERAEQNILKPFTTNNYGANTDWSTTSIKTYEIGGSTAIETGGVKYAYGTKDVEVRASITHLGAVHPDLSNVEMVLWAEVYENGSVATITQASTVYDIISDSWFKPLDGYTKAKKEKNVDVYTVSAILDSSKLPKNGKITLYARIYETGTIPFTARITNDLIIRDLMDGNYRIIQ